MRPYLVLFAYLLAAALYGTPAQAADHPFAVIAAPGVSDRRLTRETVALIYQRKLHLWDNGIRVQPVNLPASHPLRRAFSLAVLGVAPEAMEDYWREMYFHGVLPPHVLASEEAVLRFVASTPGAVGYVSSCLPDRRVHVIFTQGELPACTSGQ